MQVRVVQNVHLGMLHDAHISKSHPLHLLRTLAKRADFAFAEAPEWSKQVGILESQSHACQGLGLLLHLSEPILTSALGSFSAVSLR